MDIREFRKLVLDFYSIQKRSFLWRETTDPYSILVSEFMLQQTQTDRVTPKYTAFINHFPDFKTLAQANQAEVLRYWQGLGYNRRALYLHKAAQQVHTRFNDQLPWDQDTLQTLPGIGPYTAAAIVAFAFNEPAVVIETNIRTVFIHHFFADSDRVYDRDILPLIEETMDTKCPREWYYALMDYGVYLKKLHPNPNRKSKHYTKQSRFEGSDRQMRGAILRMLIHEKYMSYNELTKRLSADNPRLHTILSNLEREGFLTINDNQLSLKD